MSTLSHRFDGLRPKIKEIMAFGGTPGLSLGVMRKGSQVYYASYGHRDQEKGLDIDEETVFPVCSLTKAVMAAAIGILVEEKKATWNTLVKDVLPAFDIKDETLQNFTTITDLLCHRTGMSWGDNLFLGTENNVLISSDNAMKYINSQTRLLPFRYEFPYNNIAYELAGKVIESLSGESYFDFLQTRILNPLGMDRTFLVTPSSKVKNVAVCYNALADGSAAPIPSIKSGDDWFGAASAGMRTCVRDLMKLYDAFLTSFNDQFTTNQTSTEGSPLKQVRQLMSAKIANDQPSRNESSYVSGWQRVQLPGKMGQIGNNPGLIPSGMPVVGKGVSSQLVIFHQGSGPGALAIVILHPDTETAIVIQTDALSLNDVLDWVGQLILEEFLEVPESEGNDYIKFAEQSVLESLKWHPALVEELRGAQKNGTSHRALEGYVGIYWDHSRVFKIVVTLEDGYLFWYLQELESEKFPLKHYEDDTFTWILSRNELSRRGRWVGADQGPDFWKARFWVGESGKVDKLFWVHDSGVPAAVYSKE